MRKFIYGIFLFWIVSTDCFLSHKHSISIKHPIQGMKVVRTIEQRKSKVSIIKDTNGVLYCVKQVKRNAAQAQFSLIREILASCVAQTCNLPVNYVRIIPPGFNFPGKEFKDRIALLSTFISGKSINNFEIYAQRSIKQWWGKSLSMCDCGLTKSVITNMSIHNDLCTIAAYDTFISNTDRCRSNLFYDGKQHRFYGIDQEIAFKLPYEKNLSAVACLQIKSFLTNSSFKLNSKELFALKKYNNTLKKLIKKNPPYRLHNVLDELKSMQNIIIVFQNDPNFELEQVIQKYKTKINLQYQKSLELVDLIDQLVEKTISNI